MEEIEVGVLRGWAIWTWKWDSYDDRKWETRQPRSWSGKMIAQHKTLDLLTGHAQIPHCLLNGETALRSTKSVLAVETSEGKAERWMARTKQQHGYGNKIKYGYARLEILLYIGVGQKGLCGLDNHCRWILA